MLSQKVSASYIEKSKKSGKGAASTKSLANTKFSNPTELNSYVESLIHEVQLSVKIIEFVDKNSNSNELKDSILYKVFFFILKFNC